MQSLSVLFGNTQILARTAADNHINLADVLCKIYLTHIANLYCVGVIFLRDLYCILVNITQRFYFVAFIAFLNSMLRYAKSMLQPQLHPIL